MPAPPQLPPPKKRSFWGKFFRNQGAILPMTGVVGLIYLSAFSPYIALLPSALATTLYPLKKIYNAGRNIFLRHSKLARSAYRLAGIAGGGYAGATQGAILGAAIGSVLLPGIGTLAGSVVGTIIGTVAGGTAGALFTKYSAKFMSYWVYGDTNPEKWSFTQKKAHEMSKKTDSLQKRRVTPGQVLTAMDALAAAKNQTQGLGSIPGTVDRQKKERLNHLLKEIRDGNFVVRETAEKKEKLAFLQEECGIARATIENEKATAEEKQKAKDRRQLLTEAFTEETRKKEEEFSGYDVYLVSPSKSECWGHHQSSNTSLFLYADCDGTFSYYDGTQRKQLTDINGNIINVSAKEKNQENNDNLRDLSLLFPTPTDEPPAPYKMDKSNPMRIEILKITSQQGGTGSKPPIKMLKEKDEAELMDVCKLGFFKNNKKRATLAATQDKDRDLESWESFIPQCVRKKGAN